MKVIARLALVAGLVVGGPYVSIGSARAGQCMQAGGWGAKVLPGVAEFMAAAAMKNSAKARLGSSEIKVGPISQKCEQKGLWTECHARAKICT